MKSTLGCRMATIFMDMEVYVSKLHLELIKSLNDFALAPKNRSKAFQNFPLTKLNIINISNGFISIIIPLLENDIKTVQNIIELVYSEGQCGKLLYLSEGLSTNMGNLILHIHLPSHFIVPHSMVSLFPVLPRGPIPCLACPLLRCIIPIFSQHQVDREKGAPHPHPLFLLF